MRQTTTASVVVALILAGCGPSPSGTVDATGGNVDGSGAGDALVFVDAVPFADAVTCTEPPNLATTASARRVERARPPVRAQTDVRSFFLLLAPAYLVA